AASGSTDGADGVLSGTQLLGDLGIPVMLGGNAISLLGDASSTGASTASAGSAAGDPEGTTSGTDSTPGGTQLLADAGVPVTLGGNAISLLGDASGGGSATASGTPASGTTAGGQEGSTVGTDGVLGGTQLLADLGVPVTLAGNAISLLGDASTDAPTTDTGTVTSTDPGTDPGTDP